MSERPETWVTVCTGHMGDTSRQACLAGGVDALEGVFGHGRASSVCCPTAGGRGDERGLSRIRRLAQDRLQDLRAVQGAWARGLTDRSRRPVRYANQLPPQIESLIVRCKQDKPHWGARKIRELLVRRLDGDVRLPATIHAVLHRHGLVKGIGRARHRATGTPLSQGGAPNDLWCADF